MPTGIWSLRLRSGWKSRLRSGSAHCDLQLAVEVRQCPLGSGARSGGPAVGSGSQEAEEAEAEADEAEAEEEEENSPDKI